MRRKHRVHFDFLHIRRRVDHGVARKVEVALGDEASRPVLAAALLHDVGKTESGLSTYGRVIATISGGVVGRDPEIVAMRPPSLGHIAANHFNALKWV